jgi:glutamyl-Q tRNA(Asp) synthetase
VNSISNKHDLSYVGRFAPSPTGPLHFGSLIAAVASYLDAKANSGLWLMRMEDLDPPREPEGAAEKILDQLLSLGLEWDGDVLYQSTRLNDYEKALQQLVAKGLCYECDCTRPTIKAMGSVYNGQCRNRTSKPESDFAIRLRTEDRDIEFEDLVQGKYCQNVEVEVGDFSILRKDKLFAYQLAVVVDDALQNITHIIRGNDLIDSTPRQIYLQQLLNYKIPSYGHIPVIVNDQGQKLSKQHFATPIDADNGPQLIHQSLEFLGLRPPDENRHATVEEQLAWGLEVWDIQAVPKLATIPENSLKAE